MLADQEQLIAKQMDDKQALPNLWVQRALVGHPTLFNHLD